MATGGAEIWTSEILRSRDVLGLLRRLTGSPWRLSGCGIAPKSWDWEPNPIPSPTEGKKEAFAAASWFMKDSVYGLPSPEPTSFQVCLPQAQTGLGHLDTNHSLCSDQFALSCLEFCSFFLYPVDPCPYWCLTSFCRLYMSGDTCQF